MKLCFILLMFPTLLFAFECLDKREITTEKNEKVVLCTSNHLQVSEKCAAGPKNCQLIKDLSHKIHEQKQRIVLVNSEAGTGGSRLCSVKGWTTLKGEMLDKSQICLCKHPSGEFISCVSLDEYYRK